MVNKKRIEKYENAIVESKRFIERAESALIEMRYDNWGGKANASAKRQSMELSNALVEVRKSDYK